MALEKLRKVWEQTLTPIVKAMSWMSPASITWIALPIGILGGLSVYLASADNMGASMLLGGGILITLAMALDGLDGPVARATGRVTRDGEITLTTPLTDYSMQSGLSVYLHLFLLMILSSG